MAAIKHDAPSADRAKLYTFLEVCTCNACKGKGGFMDTTYDRTGEWLSCASCGGTGQQFNADKVRGLLGLTRLPHE